jgi:hypothetical protein
MNQLWTFIQEQVHTNNFLSGGAVLMLFGGAIALLRNQESCLVTEPMVGRSKRYREIWKLVVHVLSGVVSSHHIQAQNHHLELVPSFKSSKSLFRTLSYQLLFQRYAQQFVTQCPIVFIPMFVRSQWKHYETTSINSYALPG